MRPRVAIKTAVWERLARILSTRYMLSLAH